MKHIKSAGGIVINPNGQVLVITNQIGKHTFPKGRREPGETTEENAIREVTEETGLARLELVRHIGVLSRPGHTAENPDTPSVIKHIDFFHFTTDELELKPVVSDVVEAQWVLPDKLSKILTWPEELAFFERHRTKLGLNKDLS